MKGKVVLLGTSSGIPTKDRNTTSVYLQFSGDGFLFDCGEGTQRQIFKADLNINRINYIFLTHLHGDHVLGLPGLIQTLDFHGKKRIKVFGTPTTKERIECLLRGSIYAQEIEVDVEEIKPPESVERIYEDENFYINAVSMNHVVDCVGYSFVEKDRTVYRKELIKKLNLTASDFISLEKRGYTKKNGRVIKREELKEIKRGFKFTFVTDTYRTDNIIKLAKNSDILVIESTYLNEEEKAREYKHLTLEYILEIYQEINCKKIILTHFSRKYANLKSFEREIKKRGYYNIYLGYDFFTVEF